MRSQLRSNYSDRPRQTNSEAIDCGVRLAISLATFLFGSFRHDSAQRAGVTTHGTPLIKKPLIRWFLSGQNSAASVRFGAFIRFTTIYG